MMNIEKYAIRLVLFLLLAVMTGCADVRNAVETPADRVESNGNAANVGTDAQPNIIAVQLEAFQSFVLNREVNGVEITPNLNALIKESAYFSNFYLQNGGGSTSDAEFMMNTGLHPFKAPQSIAVDAADKQFAALPRLLGPLGYYSTTLHVNNVMFWNRKNFYSALGFDSYYDKAYFGLSDVIASGSSDQVLFEKGIEVLKTLDRPFYAQFITMSSHYPFRMPAKLMTMELPEGFEGNMAGDYLHSVRYADEALGRFIAALKEEGLWENSIFVVYGDHAGLQMRFVKEKEDAALTALLGRAYDRIDALQVPLIIHGKGVAAGEYKQAGGHMDIMPTLTSLLGIELPTPVFGYDLFKSEDHPVAVRSSFAEEGSFVYKNVFFDAADESLLSLETREAPPEVPFDVEEVRRQLQERFQASDAFIRALPTKQSSFGVEIELTETSDVYETPEDVDSVIDTLPAKSVIATYRNDGDWYSFYDETGKEVWVLTEHPIQEAYQIVETKQKEKLYSEPNEESKPRLEIGKQTLYALKEWKGTGWYQVSTWTGEDLWVNID